MNLLEGAGGNGEVDEEGWQKLPLHVEMDMLRQAAMGEDGAPASCDSSQGIILCLKAFFCFTALVVEGLLEDQCTGQNSFASRGST